MKARKAFLEEKHDGMVLNIEFGTRVGMDFRH